MKKRYRLKIFLVTGFFMLALSIIAILNNNQIMPIWNPIDIVKSVEKSDHEIGKLVNINDESGNLVSKVSRSVSTGDQIILPDGKNFKVKKVYKDYAVAKLIGTDKEYLAYCNFFDNMTIPAAAFNDNENRRVGIYHTHSAESYVPTDGTESIPFRGGIYEVGQSLVNRLKNAKIDVSYDKTPHDPHDNNAYYRSRRTAANLLKQNPVAILDVHRDGIPDANYYREKVSDTNVAQLRLVVGRQNPNMQANLDFAKRMMAYANKIHPGIVKEIFMANGTYNQDLLPTALLLEAGTHLNTKSEAERGVTLFADAIPTVAGITTPGPTGGAGTQSRGAWSALAWILGLTILGGGTYLLISSGGLKQAGSKLSSFVGQEFTGFLGPVNNIRKKFSKDKNPQQSNSTDQQRDENRHKKY